MISSFLCSKFLKYVNLSPKSLNVSSLSPPVTSFLYLAINGIVLPSSINLIVFSTCEFFTPSSCAIVTTILSIFSSFHDFGDGAKNHFIKLLLLLNCFFINSFKLRFSVS